MTKGRIILEDVKVPVRLRLSATWAALVFCYIYGDFFGLFVPGRLSRMDAGMMDPIGAATPAVLLGVSIMMAIPSAMVFLSLVIGPRLDRWINVVLGSLYTAIMILTMIGAPPFYLFFGAVEIMFSIAIIHQAWTWPRTDRAPVCESSSGGPPSPNALATEELS